MRLSSLLPSLFLATASAAAQSADSARVSLDGVVYDSVAARPLPGAIVQIVSRANPAAGPVYAVTSDSAGAYHIADVPRGDYLATFYHDRLDALGLAAGIRVVRLAGNEHADFAIPSARTVRGVLCGQRKDTDSSAAIVGTVSIVDRAEPARGATVSVQWFELAFGSKGLVRSTPTARAVTDSAGRFIICGLPGDANVDVWATSASAATGAVHLELAPFAVVSAPLAIDPTDSVGPSGGGRHGTARVSGFVRLPTGEPLPGARISIREADREAVSDETGHYALADLPAGTFSLEGRAIGFVPIARTVTLSATQPLVFDVRFDSAARILKTVEVRGKVVFDRSLQEFENAKKHGFGYFMDPEEVERRHAFDASDLLRAAPGVRVVNAGFGRAPVIVLRGDCIPEIVVDGNRFVGQTSLDDVVSATEIRAVAIYRSAAETPVEYQAGGACGAVVVWTKRTMPRRGAVKKPKP